LKTPSANRLAKPRINITDTGNEAPNAPVTIAKVVITPSVPP
jgi:hypothetical protein